MSDDMAFAVVTAKGLGKFTVNLHRYVGGWHGECNHRGHMIAIYINPEQR
jgi:hypothetical protein